MKPITIKSKGYKIESCYSVLPAIILERGKRRASLTLGWWIWAFEIEFKKGE